MNRPNSLRLGASFVAAAVVASTVPGVAHAGSNIVIAPKSGQKLTHSPVKVSVRAGWKVRELRVWLNGKSVSEEFRRADIGKRNRRTVRLSASHGLRYGRNVVRVSTKRFMRKRRSHRVRFILTRDRPLVGAGRDRRVEVGRSIRLNGYDSRGRNAPRAGRAHRSARPGSAAGLRMRWRLVRKPTGSKAKICCRARGVQPPAQKLARLQAPVPQPARPWLKNLDKPGRYVAKLVVVDRGVRSVADRVATTALVGTPLVPVDTMAHSNAQPGIAIGYHPFSQVGPKGPDQRFFPLGQGNLLQLVVLDRRTLETIESWSGPASDQSIATLTAKLKQYEDNRLAIVTAWSDFTAWRSVAGGHPTDALVNTRGQGVNLIGASSLSRSEVSVGGLESRPPGARSWIGVPGFAPGEAWEGGPGGPSLFTGLQGFLSPDSNDNYAYVGTSPTTFDLGRDGQSVSMTIGPMAFSGALPEGQGGFLVAYQLGTTLAPAPVGRTLPPQPSVQNGKTVYATRNADGSPNYSEMKRMTDDLNQAGSIGYPLVVAIRSIGPAPLARMGLQPPDYQGSFDQTYADALNNLASAIRNVGGTLQLIYGMATTPTGADSYSLVGSNASSIKCEHTGLVPLCVPLEGSGADLGSQLKPQGQTRLAGTLSRAKQSHYVPKVAANDDVGGALAELAVAEPTEWPHSSTPGEQAALRCIGNARGLGPDPRVAYWLQTYSDTKWLQTKQDIAQMQPAACADVDTTDFTTVRDELVTEIGWLINVHSYIDALTTPFTSDGLSSFAELNTITQQVVGEVTAVQGKQVGIDGMAIFTDVLDLVAEFEIPGYGAISKAAGAIAGALDLLRDVTAESDDGPTIDWGQRVRAASAKVGEELAGELKRISDDNKKLADIIAADYAKLSTVGRLGQCTPGAPDCTPEWQFTQPQQRAASRMYEITAKRKIWAGVLAGGYPFVLQTSSNPGSYKGQFLDAQEQISGIRCRFYPPFNVQEPVFLRYGIRQVANTPFLVFAQNNDHLPFGADLNGQDRYHPSPSLLNPLFAPRDPGGDPNKGGLGLDQYKFMIDNWQPPQIAAGGPTRVGWVGCS